MSNSQPSKTGDSNGRVVSGGTPDGKPALDFDDDEIYSGRSARAHTGGTTQAPGGDSGRLGPPTEQLSDSNGPSSPDVPRRPRGGA